MLGRLTEDLFSIIACVLPLPPLADVLLLLASCWSESVQSGGRCDGHSFIRTAAVMVQRNALLVDDVRQAAQLKKWLHQLRSSESVEDLVRREGVRGDCVAPNESVCLSCHPVPPRLVRIR